MSAFFKNGGGECKLAYVENPTRAVMSEAWQGRAYKNDPVDHFSEGARLQGSFADPARSHWRSIASKTLIDTRSIRGTSAFDAGQMRALS